MSYENPSVLGERHTLTKLYPATDSYTDPDQFGNRQPLVHGAICKSAEADNVASAYHGEEILKWTLCMASRCVKSSIPGDTLDPIKAVNIGMFETRYPGAFEEFRRSHPDLAEELPERYYGGTADIHPSLLGEYKPKEKKVASTDDKIAALQRELKRLEAAKANSGEAFPDEPEYEGADFADTAKGTPLKELQGIPKRAREVLAEKGVTTVEALAALSNDVIDLLGMGSWDKYRQMARNKLMPGKDFQPVAA